MSQKETLASGNGQDPLNSNVLLALVSSGRVLKIECTLALNGYSAFPAAFPAIYKEPEIHPQPVRRRPSKEHFYHIAKEEIEIKTATVTMHNWRFLLLAFVAVFQPIASYTERVDGRQQRCDERTSLQRDPGLNFHGTYRFNKPAVLDRRLNQREELRDTRLHEVREDSLRITSSPGRQLRDTLERGNRSPTRLGRFSQAEYRFTRDGLVLRRETRAAHLRTDYRDERRAELGRDRQLSVFGARQTNLQEDDNRSRRNANTRSTESSVSMESRRGLRGNRDNSEAQRDREIRETRITSEKAKDDVTSFNRNDRHIVNERAQRMDTRRSESRIQQDRNADREVLSRRHRDTVTRSSSNDRENRGYNNERTRMVKRDLQSLDRDERRSIESRRNYDGHKQERDINRSRAAFYRNTDSVERRNIREASDRINNVRNLQSDRASESRRVSRERKAELLVRGQLVDNRRENRYSEVRLSENWESQESQIIRRERSLESRRDARDARSLNRDSRSLDRTVENRSDSRSSNSARDSYRREIRNIPKESRILNSEAASNRVRTTEIKGDVIRQTCPINRERSTERRSPTRDTERTSRILTVTRSTDNQRLTRTGEKDTRKVELERFADSRRDIRNTERESGVLGRDRISEHRSNSRMNTRDVRVINRERSLEMQRDSRTVRLEDNNRRNVRNVERLSGSDRVADNHRVAQGNNRDVQTLGQRQYSEVRDSQNIRKDSRESTRERSVENRRDIRNHEKLEGARFIQNQRATRGSEESFRSFRRERSVENRRDIRNVDKEFRTIASDRVAENRRARTTESRRIRNIAPDFRTEGERRVESRVAHLRRSRENLSMDRKDRRAIERLNIREILLDNRRSRSVGQREFRLQTQRLSERNNMELERREVESLNRFNMELARKREFLGIGQNPAQAETPATNWQYLFYTLQGLYICGVLTQLLNEKKAGKKYRATSWWSAPQHLIKVD